MAGHSLRGDEAGAHGYRHKEQRVRLTEHGCFAQSRALLFCRLSNSGGRSGAVLGAAYYSDVRPLMV